MSKHAENTEPNGDNDKRLDNLNLERSLLNDLFKSKLILTETFFTTTDNVTANTIRDHAYLLLDSTANTRKTYNTLTSGISRHSSEGINVNYRSDKLPENLCDSLFKIIDQWRNDEWNNVSTDIFSNKHAPNSIEKKSVLINSADNIINTNNNNAIVFGWNSGSNNNAFAKTTDDNAMYPDKTSIKKNDTIINNFTGEKKRITNEKLFNVAQKSLLKITQFQKINHKNASENDNNRKGHARDKFVTNNDNCNINISSDNTIKNSKIFFRMDPLMEFKPQRIIEHIDSSKNKDNNKRLRKKNHRKSALWFWQKKGSNNHTGTSAKDNKAYKGHSFQTVPKDFKSDDGNKKQDIGSSLDVDILKSESSSSVDKLHVNVEKVEQLTGIPKNNCENTNVIINDSNGNDSNNDIHDNDDDEFSEFYSSIAGDNLSTKDTHNTPEMGSDSDAITARVSPFSNNTTTTNIPLELSVNSLNSFTPLQPKKKYSTNP
ncbi:uncharacterized protein SCDLUD_004918 [Saccharomycodes ludwigii]|uniref:uncharacterized protein n=1 Tax=Saccharomycodes ludwigii TaxID=36035 RepID=UPI001E84CF4B|nr:hypothetical protein SCDLUD_004918 [Saccharomycodes ludwigii]KAH3899474.1 hypothetical protein SCDLUD_004918 [Saccharomycodes ludwigii]